MNILDAQLRKQAGILDVGRNFAKGWRGLMTNSKIKGLEHAIDSAAHKGDKALLDDLAKEMNKAQYKLTDS